MPLCAVRMRELYFPTHVYTNGGQKRAREEREKEGVPGSSQASGGSEAAPDASKMEPSDKGN